MGADFHRDGRITAVVYGVLIAIAMVFSVPGLLRLSKRAVQLAPLDDEQRRHAVLGEFYATFTARHESLPLDVDVAILMSELRDVDRGVFVNYYAYPRRTRFYYGLDSYRNDARERRPATIWYIDLDSREHVRQMSYEAIRVEQSRDLEPITSLQPFAELEREVIVPLVAAVDGRGNEWFTTDAVFRAEKDTVVRLRLMPDDRECTVALTAGANVIRSDLLPGCFGRTGIGWLRVSADARASAGFWLVNRGANTMARIRLFTAPSAGTILLAGGERVWVLNTGDASVTSQVNAAEVTLEPRTLISLTGRLEGNEVRSLSPLIAFSSRKERDGNTTFGWPGGSE